MLYLYQGNHLEVLADELAAVMAARPLPPFAVETVVVPHAGVGRWLALRLASRLDIVANVDFPLPAAFIWRLFRDHLPAVPGENHYEPAVLAWSILGWLQESGKDQAFAPLARYLAGCSCAIPDADDTTSNRWAGADSRKAYELAFRLAQVFDRYLIYRPEWISAWEEGRSAVAGDEWQAALWRHLADRGGEHWGSLCRDFLRLPATEAATSRRLPPRFCLFGAPALSPGYLGLLAHLARHADLHFFLLNPCSQYWTEIVAPREKERLELVAGGRSCDIPGARDTHSIQSVGDELYLEVGNPLLASLGRQGRDFFAGIAELDPIDRDCFVPADDGTILGRLQNDILELRDASQEPRPLPVADFSLQIHSCHSPMREAEVLYDCLLDLFERIPGLAASDILVLTPDMDAYGPVLQAVFAEPGARPDGGSVAGARDGARATGRPAIPFTLAHSLTAQSPVTTAFFQLLAIPGSRFEAAALAALLEVPSLARRFGIDADEVPLCLSWLREAGIRWGWDSAGRASQGLPPLAANTWRAGLDRLLLGCALPGTDLFQGILPCDGIEGTRTAVLGGLVSFAEELHRLDRELAAPRPPAAWAEALIELLARFFSPDEEEERELQLIRDKISLFRTQTERAGFAAAIDLATLRHHLDQAMAGGGERRFLGGGVTIAAFVSMRSLPFQVICLLGMNDRAFPRDELPAAFDLMGRDFRPGDRGRRADDRYLFLETMISARRCLYLSYTGQDQRENSILPPSVLVSEVLDYLAVSYRTDFPGGVREALVRRHPLQPFSRRYFDGGALFSYSRDLAAASGLAAASQVTALLVPTALPTPGDEWRQVTIPRLLQFVAGPVRFFLRERLHVFLETEDEELASVEPVDMPFFDGIALEERMVAALQAGKETAALFAIEQARGSLPHGRWGERYFDSLAARGEKLLVLTRQLLSIPPVPPLAIDLEIGGYRLTGTMGDLRPTAREGLVPGEPGMAIARPTAREGLVPGEPGMAIARPGGRVVLSVHPPWDSDRGKLWVSHLILCAAVPSGIEPVTRCLWPEGSLTLGPVAEAGALLAQLLELYWQGLCRPLPLFPKASLAFAEEVNKGDELKAMNAARARWEGNDQQRGEADNPYHQLAFRGRDVLDHEFRSLALTLFDPYIKNRQEETHAIS